MNAKPIEKVELPYASTVASFYGEQGAAAGKSFVSELFRGQMNRPRINQTFAPPRATTTPTTSVTNAPRTSRGNS